MDDIQQPSVPEQTSKFKNLFKDKTKILLFFGAVVLELIIFISAIISIKNTLTNPNQPMTQIQVTLDPTVSPRQVPQPTLTSQEKSKVITDTKPQIDKLITIQYTITHITNYGDNWAVMEVNSTSTDPANIVLEKEKGVWVIKLGPGTSFDPSDLKAIGAPRNLQTGANSNF